MKYISFIFLLLLLSIHPFAFAQEPVVDINGQEILLENKQIQFETTEAIDDMYNFKFDRAAQQFTWLKQKYKDHPLGYFLLALNEWWKMMPRIDVELYDKSCLAYCDSAIVRAKKMYKTNKKNIEGSFFLAAAYGMKSRVYSERKKWGAAVFSGKACLKYLKRGKKLKELSPELLFGEGLYNYYSVWIPDNYPLLIPVLAFFKKGERQLGMEQLKEVSRNAFYTRIEALYFLMRIYRDEYIENRNLTKKYAKKNKKKYEEAKKKKTEYKELLFYVSELLVDSYPENAYFKRYYAGICFMDGRLKPMYKHAQEILTGISLGKSGFEATSGRYAAYYSAYYHDKYKANPEKAKEFYVLTVKYAEEIKATYSLYYTESIWFLANYYAKKKNVKEAKDYFQKIKKYSRKKNKKYYLAAKKYLRKHRKE